MDNKELYNKIRNYRINPIMSDKYFVKNVIGDIIGTCQQIVANMTKEYYLSDFYDLDWIDDFAGIYGELYHLDVVKEFIPDEFDIFNLDCSMISVQDVFDYISAANFDYNYANKKSNGKIYDFSTNYDMVVLYKIIDVFEKIALINLQDDYIDKYQIKIQI